MRSKAYEKKHLAQSLVILKWVPYNKFLPVRVSLFIPCFIDQLYPTVQPSAWSRCSSGSGHTVEYDERQTCCGQPAFNSGYWPEARSVAERMLSIFRDADYVVSASGSCGAMLKVFYPELFKGHPGRKQRARALAESLRVLGFPRQRAGRQRRGRAVSGEGDVPRRLPRAARTGHQAAAARLLSAVRDLELIEMNGTETCCGFGGTFAAKMPSISTAMGEVKCAHALETGADYIVSNDSSCLMQIQGLLDRQGHGKKLRSLHLAEVLASV